MRHDSESLGLVSTAVSGKPGQQGLTDFIHPTVGSSWLAKLPTCTAEGPPRPLVSFPARVPWGGTRGPRKPRPRLTGQNCPTATLAGRGSGGAAVLAGGLHRNQALSKEELE